MSSLGNYHHLASVGPSKRGPNWSPIITLALIFSGFFSNSSDNVLGQDPFDDIVPTMEDSAEDDPFGLPFTDSTTDSQSTPRTPSSISISRNGTIKIVGPDEVPNLHIIGTLRFGIDGVSNPEDRSNQVHFKNSDLRIEGSALESNHFRFRADLDGTRSPGLFSEAWIDREIRNGIHLTGGRMPNSLGLQGGLPPEDRLTISHSLLDWIDEGSCWALRVGGRWLNDAITCDFQTRLGGAADLRGDFFGGQGFSGRISMQPFAPLLFGGPTADNSSEKHFTAFLSGRWDQEVDGHFQIESPGESLLYRSENLQMDSSRWVRAGWRWPILDWLHLENEWSRTGFFGIQSGGSAFDFPGEFDGWQLALRVLPFSNQPLVTRVGPDLPPVLFDATGPFDRRNLEVLVRYEDTDFGDQMTLQGLVDPATDAGSAQVLRLGIASRPTPWFRWLLEATRTVTERPISAFNDDESDSIRILFEIGG